MRRLGTKELSPGTESLFGFPFCKGAIILGFKDLLVGLTWEAGYLNVPAFILRCKPSLETRVLTAPFTVIVSGTVNLACFDDRSRQEIEAILVSCVHSIPARMYLQGDGHENTSQDPK